uniref:Cytosolic carboxypeptidase N-terminal domain-containing protein n=1 Tax=Anas zonorhyncha TaxID=75864 RepID=A0A8B9U5M5_9AVES
MAACGRHGEGRREGRREGGARDSPGGDVCCHGDARAASRAGWGGAGGMTTNMAERSRTAETGSDIGGDDIIAGNVSKYTVLPAGYCGQPKKGHLIFDACFESGNLGRVDHITEFEYDLFIRPDTCNPRFRVWFNFTVENVKESQLSLKVNEKMLEVSKMCLKKKISVFPLLSIF